MRNRTKTVDPTAEYRSALIAERTRMLGGSQSDRDALVVPSGMALEDQAPLMHDQYLAIRQRVIDGRKLKLIEAALARLEQGEFGICDDCGEAIPAKRLEAVPWTECCVPCQDRRDAPGDAEAEERLKMIA